jgi:hypothetical protein
MEGVSIRPQSGGEQEQQAEGLDYGHMFLYSTEHGGGSLTLERPIHRRVMDMAGRTSRTYRAYGT